VRVLTCIGDATSIHTWSSTPYFLLHAGKRAGFLDEGWRLDPERLRWRRLMWNAWRVVRGGERGGFQYSRYFLRRMLMQTRSSGESMEVVSHFPLFPPLECNRALVSFYIDATLAQNFEDYGGGARVGSRMIDDALAREREHYRTAERIVCMSHWAARSVVERYGIAPDKVSVVPGGANLDDDRITVTPPTTIVPLRPLRLGFVGKDWRRKGLPFLLEVAEILAARDIPVEVVAAGFAPEYGPRHRLLRAVGFIDKHREMERFVDLVRSFHFGCLFSSAEASPRSNLECLRLGIPVLARDTGGIADTLPEGLGHLFQADAMPDAVAAVLEAYVREPESYHLLRSRLAARAAEFSWAHAVRQLARIWEGGTECSYASRLR
jgi:glycosyltransferase involved in cell wall biosynthesis